MSGAKRYLLAKLGCCDTREGKFIVIEALWLSLWYHDLTGPQLIRLAYWGVSGSAED